MSWLDDLFAPAPSLPFDPPKLPEPKVMGRYGYDQGAEAELERMINAAAPIFGFARVAIDDHISDADATRVVAIQRGLYQNYACDAATRDAGIAKLESDLTQAAALAKFEQGITVTPEQMWTSLNQRGILEKLPPLLASISSGKLRPCGASTKTWLVLGALAVGGVMLLGRKRRR